MSRVEMSRRVSSLMNTDVMQKLSRADRTAFINAVEASEQMSDLKPDYQQLILSAEKECKDAGWVWDPSAGRMQTVLSKGYDAEEKRPVIKVRKLSSGER